MFKSFIYDTEGAITVDWVVLTAAVTGLGLAVVSVISVGLEDLANDIQAELSSVNTTTGGIDPWNPNHPTYVACQSSDVDIESEVANLVDAYNNTDYDPLANNAEYRALMEQAILNDTYADNVAGREHHQCKIDVTQGVIDHLELG